MEKDREKKGKNSDKEAEQQNTSMNTI